MQEKVYGLNIYLQAFQLNQDLIHNSEKIRVSITTLPDEKKQHFVINPKKVGNANHNFNVNISNNTCKIIFVFRRKGLLTNDQIIASTCIKREDLPETPNDKSNNKMMIIKIFEPHNQKHDCKTGISGVSCHCDMKENKRILGQMSVQFQLTDPFPEQEYQSCKMRRSSSSSKFKYSKMSNNENMEDNLI